MYRANAARTGFTPEALEEKLHLNWTYQALHRPQPAWPRNNRVFYDRVYRTVICEGTVYFGGSVDGKVYALDLQTGEPKWVFYTEGPVRLAPAVWKRTVFVTSDDGHLYALSASDGTLKWKHRGGPSDSLILGNGHMISKWPARGGAVVLNDTVYYGAGLWPSEGFFLYALDADTGKLIWKNDDSGGLYIKNPHGALAKSGVASQGHLAATEDLLFVPTGRAVPACFDRKTGQYKYFHLSRYGSMGPSGGDQVMVAGDKLVVNGRLFNTHDGISPMHSGGLGRKVSIYPTDTHGLFTFAHPEKGFVSSGNSKQRNRSITLHQLTEKAKVLRKGKAIKYQALETVWSVEEASLPSACLIGSGDRLISGGKDSVQMIDFDTQKIVWSAEVSGTVFGLAVADGRLLASTDRGTLYCFGAERTTPRAIKPAASAPSPGQSVVEAAREIVNKARIAKGYCLDLGCADGRLSYELARQTHLKVVAVANDPKSFERARAMLDAAGYLGSRVTLLKRDLKKTGLPDYFANLVISAQSLLQGKPLPIAEAKRAQRPYGGVLCSGRRGDIRTAIRRGVEGAGKWTHQYADAANTLCSGDLLVKGDLSILWFADIPFDLANRHGRSPAPLFDRGRLFYAGLNGLIAVDGYNGHEIWRYAIKGLLKSYHAEDLMGASGTGGNSCLDDTSVYLRHENRCLRIDASSGKLIRTYELPEGEGEAWGYIAYARGKLFGSTADRSHVVAARWRDRGNMGMHFTESKDLFAVDVKTGNRLWTYQATHSIRHNAIAIGTAHAFLIDRPVALMDRRKKRGAKPLPKGAIHETGTLVALDSQTGEVAWRNDENIYGTVLALSVDHKALLMSYQPQKWLLPSEKGARMAVFDIRDGKRLWDKEMKYRTRPILNGRTIQTPSGAWDLLTGASVRGKFSRGFGCGLLTSSRHMMLFRRGTLGYFNLQGAGEVQYFGGMRPGCWINVIPAGGIVLAPNGSTGCTCNYLNESWLALQPVPE